jgi:hypothetical protein
MMIWIFYLFSKSGAFGSFFSHEEEEEEEEESFV